MLNATYQSGTYTRKIAQLKSQSIAELKFGGDLGEIIAVYPQVSLSSAEVSSGRINYGGRLICTLVYVDGDNKLCRIQKGVEFSHFADDDRLAPAQFCECELICERTSVKREGSNYVLSVVVCAMITVCDSAERGYISALEGAIVRREEGKLFNAVAFSGESETEDDFNLVASDILVPAAKPVILNCAVKTGLIEISGEIYLSLLAVREDSPVAVDRVIPFKAEIACEQAVVPSPVNCRAEIKDMSVDCKVNEEKGKCDVTFTSTLAFFGEFYEEEQTTIISDAFSPDKELKLDFGEESYETCSDIKVYSERVSGLCASKAKLDYTCAFLAAALPKAEFTRTQDGVEGCVTATLIYSQGGEIHSSQISLPYSLKLGGLSGSGKTDIAVSGVSVRQRAEGECEAEAALKITVCDGAKERVKYLTAAEECGDKKQIDSAISVYIPAAGDGLWETAKKLSVEPDGIKAANPELNFPLSGKERILIFRGRK